MISQAPCVFLSPAERKEIKEIFSPTKTEAPALSVYFFYLTIVFVFHDSAI